MKNLLLHICCAPCLIYPHLKLKNKSIKITGFFFNPNIYPKEEYNLRLQALKKYTEVIDLSVIYDDSFSHDIFYENNLKYEFDTEKRCEYCYSIRLEQTAKYASENNFSHFSCTLLYSRYQKHELIKSIAEQQAKKYNVQFYYEDFRPGWYEAIKYSKQIGMYRQKYCGCISSLNGDKKNVKR